MTVEVGISADQSGVEVVIWELSEVDAIDAEAMAIQWRMKEERNPAKGSSEESYLTLALRDRKRKTNLRDTEKDCQIKEKIKRTALWKA